MKYLKLLVLIATTMIASMGWACSFAPNNSSVEEVYNKLMNNPKLAVANIKILKVQKKSNLMGSSRLIYTFKVLEGFKNVKSSKALTVEGNTSSCGYFREKGTEDFVVMTFDNGKYSIMEQTPYNFESKKLLDYFRAQQTGKIKSEKPKTTTKEKFKTKRFKEL